MTPTIRRTFGARGFGASVAPQSLGKPGAVYPAAVATDSDMMIAVDRQQASLLLPLTATATSMTVLDPSMIVAYNLLSIDNEIVKTTGAPAGNVVPISRGFDGTTPASHPAGAVVAGLIDAYHHNRLVAEVEAIEQALGPNLSHVAGSVLITAPAYAFAAQTPGGTLNPGTNSIALSPVPQGVNGTDANHYLYISGGTGTAEAVIVTGGTAVSGAASGTVFVTCANSHSGAWTIQTATAGIQEAHNANPSKCINVPGGLYDFYGTVWSNGNLYVQGDGVNATTLQMHALNLKMFQVEREYFGISDMTLRQLGTGVAGSTGINTAGTWSTVAGAAANWINIKNVQLYGFYNGLLTDGGSQALNLTNVIVANCKQDGIVCKGSQGYWFTIISLNNAGNGITVSLPTGGSGGGTTLMTGIQTFNNGGWGLYSTTLVYVSGINSFFNADKLGEIYVSHAGANAGWITDASIQFAGLSTSWGTLNTAPGILIDTNTGPMTLDNIQFFNGQGNDITVKSGLHNICHCYCEGSGQGGQAGNVYSVLATNSGQINVHDNTLGLTKLTGNYMDVFDNQFSSNSASPLLEIGGGSVHCTISRTMFTQSGTGSALTVDAGADVILDNNTWFSGSVVMNGSIDSPAQAKIANYTADVGANNAIAANITGVVLTDALRVTIILNHTLAGGAVNTFNFNGGGAVPIRSSRAPVTNITTGYSTSGIINLQYNQALACWVDLSQ